MITISLPETFTKIYIDFICTRTLYSQAYIVNIVLVFYFVMSCDCQLITKENDDDDDDDDDDHDDDDDDVVPC